MATTLLKDSSKTGLAAQRKAASHLHVIRQHTSLSSAFIAFCISRYIQRCTEPATAKIEDLPNEQRLLNSSF